MSLTILDSHLLSTLTGALVALVGSTLTTLLARRGEIDIEARKRSLNLMDDALEALAVLQRQLDELSYHAPRGGGRISYIVDGVEKTEVIPTEAAKESDLRASSLMVKELPDTLKQIDTFALRMGVLGFGELGCLIAAVSERVWKYVRREALVPDGEGRYRFKGLAMRRLQEDIGKQLDELAHYASNTVVKGK